MNNIGLLTGLGVGFATLFGGLIGVCVKEISHKLNDIMLGFAAGIMLFASIIGLIMPSVTIGGDKGIFYCVAGVIIGAAFISVLDFIVPHIHHQEDETGCNHKEIKYKNKVVLFVLAIAIHNLPEGLAVGVGFGSDNIANAMMIAIGIALQNIPEGLVVIFPLLSIGLSKGRALFIAMLTGVVEVVGVVLGLSVVGFSKMILPFALAFAGGTMLYVISDELIPETHNHGYEKQATFALIIGFVLMLCMDYYLT